MKYALATWRIFVAWAAKRLHLPQRIVRELEDRAHVAMLACSLEDWDSPEDAIYDAINADPAEVARLRKARRDAREGRRAPRQLVGWACDHMSMTAGAGFKSPPTAGCGCHMRPVYTP
jgi:hypothetical protein